MSRYNQIMEQIRKNPDDKMLIFRREINKFLDAFLISVEMLDELMRGYVNIFSQDDINYIIDSLRRDVLQMRRLLHMHINNTNLTTYQINDIMQGLRHEIQIPVGSTKGILYMILMVLEKHSNTQEDLNIYIGSLLDMLADVEEVIKDLATQGHCT